MNCILTDQCLLVLYILFQNNFAILVRIVLLVDYWFDRSYKPKPLITVLALTWIVHKKEKGDQQYNVFVKISNDCQWTKFFFWEKRSNGQWEEQLTDW